MFDYDQVHEYVNTHNNAYWNGWDVVIFSPDFRAQSSKKGVYSRKFNKWGYERSYSPNRAGKWKIR